MLEAHLSELQIRSVFRTLSPPSQLLDLASNDYLGLSNSSRIRQQLLHALESGVALSSTGSRLLAGNTHQHEQVESFLQTLFKVESALIFSSGFLANMGVMTAFESDQSEYFSDELNHASLIDGMRLARGKRSVFRHNDLNHLETLLCSSVAPIKVIVSESVFSMDGDLAPLSGLCELAERHSAYLVIDEAHSTGVFGRRGLGCMDDLEHKPEGLVVVHTAGKALGSQGAFVLSTRKFRDLLVNRARSFIFSTALSPLSVLHIEYALREIVALPGLGARLLQTAQALRSGLPAALGQSQIVPLVVGSNEQAVHLADQLRHRGFEVRAIRYPTVKKGSERLRLTLKSFHSDEIYQKLREAVREVWPK
jgi:8-amino-7-oxononanoate synthase